MIREVLILASVGGVAVLSAQAAVAQSVPAFEIVSIKPSPEPNGRFGVIPGVPQGPGRWVAQNATLAAILRTVYSDYRFPGQIVGAPEWVEREMWHIEATYPPDTPNAEVRRMAQALLADQFKLVTHVEQRALPVFALVPASADRRLGPRLRLPSGNCVAGTVSQECASGYTMRGTTLTFRARNLDLTPLLDVLAETVERPVVDQTDLSGRFDIDLEWSIATSTAPSNSDAVTVFTAVQEQLGLKLEPAREVVDVLVIDSVEPPRPD
jgi:uncharacterized protein (TIGR03435 family)